MNLNKEMQSNSLFFFSSFFCGGGTKMENQFRTMYIIVHMGWI